jgi:hypothetical protein
MDKENPVEPGGGSGSTGDLHTTASEGVTAAAN